MKRFLTLFLAVPTLLGGCHASLPPSEKQYTATFLTLFDTVTTIVGTSDSEESFRENIQPLHDELEYYHKLFDIYQEYEGINNLKTLNDTAGLAPVVVDTAVLDLLEDCKSYYEITGGVFHPAMGSVLSLWHDAREDGTNDPANAYLPDTDALAEAARHMNPDDIVLDREASTVFFKDSQLRLDVGGIAKGWAVQRVRDIIPEGVLLSVGGNVYAAGPKDSAGTPWAVGLQNPDGSDNYLHILNITEGSVVTSGSYHRAYVVDGTLYHHIIDPRTLYPGERWTSVSVVCENSGLADVLSTALFLLSREEGQALLDSYDAKALWVDPTGNRFYSPGFRELIRN